MASNTPNLNLLKKDPVEDGADTFNIQTMLNDNWDKIDQAVGEVREELQDIDIPPASLTKPGIVQLSNSTNGTREDVAATEKAVKSTFDTATAAQTTANTANLAAAAAQAKADAAETPSGAQAKVNAAVGSLPSLLTSAKGNAVAAINELFTSASNGKSQIAAAITGKGVPASGSDTFAQLAGKIGQIVTGKRYATGTAVIAETSPTTVSGMDFWPRVVFYTVPEYAYCSFIFRLPVMGRENNYGYLLGYSSFGTGGARYEEGSVSKQFLLPDGFNIFGPTSGGSFPMVIWYAFE